MARPSPPQYVDLQVNGYMGVDLNADDLSAEQLHAACEHLRRDGVAGILATIVTADLADMAARLARIAAYRQADALAREVIWGIHIEGPFISPLPGYVGAHPRRARSPGRPRRHAAAAGRRGRPDAAGDAGPGARPGPGGDAVAGRPRDPGLGRPLRSRAWRSSARRIDAGLSMFTHLGNGCPMMLARHDNIIQRALGLSDRLTIMFIADGVHVPYPALRNYLRVAGTERAIVVTDAISAAGLGAGTLHAGHADDRHRRRPGGPRARQRVPGRARRARCRGWRRG